MDKIKLESMRQVLVGLKMLYSCTIPDSEFEIKDAYFNFLNLETKKLLLGKLYILLADNFSGNKNKYNTISFKILIGSMLESHAKEGTDELSNILNRIEAIDEKYKKYRDKMYAHIDLSNNGTLKKTEEFNISNRDIGDLIQLSEDAYNALLLFLDNASSDHMKDPIDTLSCKLWKAYEDLGLVKKI